MLRSLSIENIALIQKQTIEFSDGFFVFTGETGAGKSLVVDSLGLVLGARADRSLIAYGKQFAVVEAVFENLTDSTTQKLYEFGFEEDEVLILSRKIYDDGRNDCRVNGRSVTVSMLKELASTLVDLCGQFENQTMFKSSNQLALIDEVCKNKKLLLELDDKLEQISKIDQKLDDLVGDEKERERLLDMLAFQIDEIEEANFVEGEEESLKEMHNKIVGREKILNSLSGALSLLDGEEFNVVDAVKSADSELGVAASFEEDTKKLKERLSEVGYELEDIVDSLHGKLNELAQNDIDIDQVEQRLDLLNNFKKKYGKTIAEIWEFCENAKQKFDMLSNNQEATAKLKQERDAFEKEAWLVAQELHNARVVASKNFAEEIKKQLVELGMKSATFDVEIERNERLTKSGFDNLTFMFSANSGVPVKPLSKVASGGELSRFMLALKCVLGLNGHIGTMIFDEIDTGISGQIGRVVGEKMYQISRSSQVVCISHLPQIACLADTNFLIEKFDDGTCATTKIKQLSEDQKIDEISRLVGGFGEGEHARLHSIEMIQNANYFKRSFLLSE